MKTLGTREIRDEWEKQFGRIYIHPLLEVYICILYTGYFVREGKQYVSEEPTPPEIFMTSEIAFQTQTVVNKHTLRLKYADSFLEGE